MTNRCKPETVTINLLSYELQEFDETPASIDAWYDRHTRDYCIKVLNAEGFQIGDAYRVGTKDDRDYMVEQLKAEYNL